MVITTKECCDLQDCAFSTNWCPKTIQSAQNEQLLHLLVGKTSIRRSMIVSC
jgi:hypothetical protein